MKHGHCQKLQHSAGTTRFCVLGIKMLYTAVAFHHLQLSSGHASRQRGNAFLSALQRVVSAGARTETL